MRRINLFLIGVVLIGLTFRLIQLGQNPPAMHADEADTGYTALSLIKTGQDPYGNSWPLQFQNQANNYRSPLYTYSVIPFVYFLGLSPEVTRIPSVIFGVLLIICTYFLLKIYFEKSSIPIVGAFLVAINPWSIHLSRTGLEVLLSVLLTTSGILFFELGKKRSYFLVFSSMVFTLSLFSYHPAKIFTPLIIVVLAIFNIKFLLKNLYMTFTFFFVLAFGIGIIGYLAIFQSGASHLGEVSIFDTSRAKMVVDNQRTQTLAPLNLSSVFSNKAVYYIREFVNSYTGPLSINYLFINGESNLDKGIGNYGQYHVFELLPFIIGGIVIWKKNKRVAAFIFLWFLIGLIPAGITKNGNYAYRDVNAMIPPIILISIGIVTAFNFLIKKRKYLFIGLYAIFSVVIFCYFVYNYYFSYPVYSRDWWAYSQKEAILYVQENRNKYEAFYINGGPDWDILYAFYKKVEPTVFIQSHKNSVSVGEKKLRKIDHVYFGDLTERNTLNVSTSGMQDNSLIIVPGHFMPKNKANKVFYGADGANVSLKAIELK